jgi:Na+/H+ antiporter NhaD/arsenite permease-like protein
MTGVFQFCAFWVSRKAGNRGMLAFTLFFILTSVMSGLTSNDVVILTGTVFLSYFTKVSDIRPTAFLMSEFTTANIGKPRARCLIVRILNELLIASMALYIGNPTNVIVSQAYNISFITYSAWMLLPTAVCILLAYIVLRILFRGDYYLPRHIKPPDSEPQSVLIDPNGAIFGLILLVCCLGTLIGTSFASIPVWMVTLPFACVMFLRDVHHDLDISFNHIFQICHRYPRPVLRTANHDTMLMHGANDDSVLHAIRLNVLNTPSSDILPDNNTYINPQDDSIVPNQADLGTIHLNNNQNKKDEHQDKTILRDRRLRTSLIPLEAQPSTTTEQVVVEDNEPSTILTKEPKIKYLQPFYHAWRWFDTRFHIVNAVAMRLPWSILPFSLGMFILIEALAESGWVGIFATAMAVFTKNYVTAVLGMVFVSILACQLLNNLVSLSHVYINNASCKLKKK